MKKYSMWLSHGKHHTPRITDLIIQLEATLNGVIHQNEDIADDIRLSLIESIESSYGGFQVLKLPYKGYKRTLEKLDKGELIKEYVKCKVDFNKLIKEREERDKNKKENKNVKKRN